MTLFGSRVFRGNHVEMRLLGWALIQHDWCPYKKGKFKHRDRLAQKEDYVTRHGSRGGGMPHEGGGLKWCIYKPRNARDCRQTTRSWEKGMEQILPYSSQKEPTLLMPWFWTSSLQNCKTISCPVYGTLLWQPQETNKHFHHSRCAWFPGSLLEVRDWILFDFGSSGLLQHLAGKSNTWRIYSLELQAANHSSWVKSSPLSVLVNKVLLEHSHTHSLMFCLWPISHYNHRVE